MAIVRPGVEGGVDAGEARVRREAAAGRPERERAAPGRELLHVRPEVVAVVLDAARPRPTACCWTAVSWWLRLAKAPSSGSKIPSLDSKLYCEASAVLTATFRSWLLAIASVDRPRRARGAALRRRGPERAARPAARAAPKRPRSAWRRSRRGQGQEARQRRAARTDREIGNLFIPVTPSSTFLRIWRPNVSRSSALFPFPVRTLPGSRGPPPQRGRPSYRTAAARTPRGPSAFPRIETGHRRPDRQRASGGRLLAAARPRDRAAGMKGAARTAARRARAARPRSDDARRVRSATPAGQRRRREEGRRVRMERPRRERRPSRPSSTIRPQYMHGDAVGDARTTTARSCEMKSIRQARLLAQVGEQVQDLRGDRHVERGDRLVADEELRAAWPAPARSRRAGAGRPRTPTGSGGPRPPGGRPPRAARRPLAGSSRARASLCTRSGSAIWSPDRHAGIERALRILKDDLDVAALARAARGPRGPSQSSPSNRISPAVGSSRRSSSRPIVLLPLPDSPTRPSVSPRADLERDAVDGPHAPVRPRRRARGGRDRP